MTEWQNRVLDLSTADRNAIAVLMQLKGCTEDEAIRSYVDVRDRIEECIIGMLKGGI